MPQQPIGLDSAISLVEGIFNMTLAEMTEVLVGACRQINCHKYDKHHCNNHENDHYMVFAGASAVSMAFALIQAQVAPELRQDYAANWMRDMQQSMRDRNDHNDAWGVCSLAAYALMPFDLVAETSDLCFLLLFI